jgi:uncharacterized membrane protein YhaH (DUF805 family)
MDNTANPFAPPTAVVSDIEAPDQATQPVKVFAFGGRIGRLRLLAYSLFAYVLAAAGGFIFAMLGAIAGSTTIAAIAGFAMIIPYFAVMACTLVQRSHDMNWSGWTALLALIPLVGLIWLVKPGTPGRNRFGAPPPPNSTAVRVGAWLLLGIGVLGIVAAIALPAYVDYYRTTPRVPAR